MRLMYPICILKRVLHQAKNVLFAHLLLQPIKCYSLEILENAAIKALLHYVMCTLDLNSQEVV